ncbi:MAG: hypothetical protein WDO13_21815 [Verrucomicrobiota bacterium]
MTLLIDQVEALIAVFKPHCKDTETLTELQALLRQEKDWIKAHYLSNRIRTKSINAFKTHNVVAELQYSFEETCAKTLHNLSGSKKPCDADTPYWIIPLALKLARALDIDERQVLDVVMS